MDIIMIIMIINVITLIMIIIITGAISATHKVHQCLHGLMPLITDQRLATQHAPFFDLKGVDGDHSDVNGVCWADDNVDAASADDDLRVYNDDLGGDKDDLAFSRRHDALVSATNHGSQTSNTAQLFDLQRGAQRIERSLKGLDSQGCHCFLLLPPLLLLSCCISWN